MANEAATVPPRLFVPRQRAHPAGAVLGAHIDAMIDLHPGGLTWRRAFPGAGHQISHARHFTRFLLADAPRQEDAEQIVAELSANAVQHTASGGPNGTFIVEVARTSTVIRVAVYDCGWGGVPRFGARCRADAARGRGLAIVAAIADQVGYDGHDEAGHRVWAELRTPDQR